jgi:O-antigen/teichoic acid export membrane protein
MFKKIAADSVVYFLGALFNQAAGFLVAVVLMRHLRVDAFGSYSFAAAIVMLFAVLSDGGLSQYVVKQINAGKEALPVLYRRFQGVQVLVSLALLAAMAVAALVMRASGEGALVLLLGLAVVVSCYMTTAFSFFLAQGERWIIFQRDVIFGVARLAFFGLGILADWSLEYLCATGAMAQIVVLGFLLIVRRRRALGYLLTFSLDLRPLKQLVLEAFPYTLLTLVNILYNKIDVLMLKHLASEQEVGYYAGATQFVFPFMFISTALMSAICPMLTRSLGQRDAFNRIHLIATAVLGGCGVLLSLSLFLASPMFYQLFFGDKFNQSLPVYQILVWYLALVFCYGGYSNTIVAKGGVRFLLALNAVMVLVNVAVNYVAIPRYGALGAAVVTIACEVVVMLVLVSYSEWWMPRAHARGATLLSKGA